MAGDKVRPFTEDFAVRSRHAFALLLLLGGVHTAQSQAGSGEPKPRFDSEGSPLPAEAIARVGSARLRANGRISQLEYSPDGKTIVSFAYGVGPGGSGSIQFWDAATGKLRQTIPAGSNWGTAVRFRADGKTLLWSCLGTLHEVDATSAKELRAITLPAVRHATGWFSTKGDLLALVQENGEVRVFATADGKEIGRVKPYPADKVDPNFATGPYPPMAFTADGERLAVRVGHHAIAVFDSRTGKRLSDVSLPLKEDIDNRIDDIHFSADGRDLLCHARHQEWFLLRDWAAAKKISPLGGKCYNEGHGAFSPDGKHIAVSNQDVFVHVYESKGGKRVHKMPTGDSYHVVAFSADGKRLVAGHGAISQWDVETGKPIGASAGPLPGVQVVRFTEGGKHLVVVTDRYEVMDWKSGRAVYRYPPAKSQPWWRTSLSRDGKLLVSPAHDDALVVLDAKTGEELGRLSGKKEGIGRRQLSPDSKRLFTSSEGSIRVWALPKLDLVRELDTSFGSLTVASPDGKCLASALQGNSGSGPVSVWELGSGKVLRSIDPPGGAAYALAFAPDSNRLVIAGGPAGTGNKLDLILVDLRTGKETRLIKGFDGSIGQLQFSPDGRSLVAIEFNNLNPGRLRVWEVSTGQQRHAFVGHANNLSGLCFSEDGSLLASSSSEAPAYVWDVYGKHLPGAAPQKWSAKYRARLWDDLSGGDALAAFQAIRGLIANPGAGVELLKERIRPTEPADSRLFKRLLAKLDEDDFESRQAAAAELEKLGYRAEAQLTDFLSRGKPSVEARRRVETMLARLDTPERILWARALEALEQIATPAAIQLLTDIAGGEPGARLTIDAGQTLARVRNRGEPK